MRRLEAHHREPGGPEAAEEGSGPLADDVALVALEADGLGQARPVEPGVVQEEAALEPLPEAEPAAELRRDDLPRMALPGELGPGVPLREVPLAEERRRIRATRHLVGEGPR